VSIGGGTTPRWSHDSRRLFFRGIGTNANAVFEVDVQMSPSFKVVGAARKLFEGPYFRSYDVAPDGRFLMIRQPERVRPPLHIIQNWFEELRQRAPVRK
jgi:hypothetical protein